MHVSQHRKIPLPRSFAAELFIWNMVKFLFVERNAHLPCFYLQVCCGGKAQAQGKSKSMDNYDTIHEEKSEDSSQQDTTNFNY